MNLQLGNFVVMPNHIHGIIIIGENKYNTQQCRQFDDGGGDATHCVSTTTTTNLANGYSNQFVPQFKNLASIIRGYKLAVTTYARKNDIEFAWQRSFHNYIIRDDTSFQNISNYILNNPQSWKEDKFYE